MNKISLIILALLFSSFSFAQEKNCFKYKDGTFKLYDKVTKETHIIKRIGNMQSEEIEGTTLKYDFEVKWINDCTYILHPTPKTITALNADYKLIVEMVEIKGNVLTLKMFPEDAPNKIMSVEVEAINPF